MAKKISTNSGCIFDTLTKAKAHYNKIRESTAINARLSEPERSDILDIYKRYCEATDWEAVDASDVTVMWDNRPRNTGGYAQTKAFFIIDATGGSQVFSIDKALAAIAI